MSCLSVPGVSAQPGCIEENRMTGLALAHCCVSTTCCLWGETPHGQRHNQHVVTTTAVNALATATSSVFLRSTASHQQIGNEARRTAFLNEGDVHGARGPAGFVTWIVFFSPPHLVLRVHHDAVKVALLWLQVIDSEFLDQHASWGHSDLTGREKKGPVCLEHSHYSADNSAIMLSAWRGGALVCVSERKCVFSYHPWVPALL